MIPSKVFFTCSFSENAFLFRKSIWSCCLVMKSFKFLISFSKLWSCSFWLNCGRQALLYEIKLSNSKLVDEAVSSGLLLKIFDSLSEPFYFSRLANCSFKVAFYFSNYFILYLVVFYLNLLVGLCGLKADIFYFSSAFSFFNILIYWLIYL